MVPDTWHNEKRRGEDMAGALYRTVQAIQDGQHDALVTECRKWAAIYSGRAWSSFDPGIARWHYLAKSEFSAEQAIYINAIRSAVDTLAARICGNNRPRPQFLTSNAQWSLRQQAQRLEQFVSGVWEDQLVYDEVDPLVFIDACVFGTGVAKVYPSEGKVRIERVLPPEVMVDEAAVLTGKPRDFYHVKKVPADVLIQRFPKKEQAIRALARQGHGEIDGEHMISVDIVPVIEGWHLPPGNGRHVIVAGDRTVLYDEKWTDKEPPFVFFRFRKMQLGFWGQGAVEDQSPTQAEFNKLLQRFQQSANLNAVSNIFYEAGTINKAHFKNTSGNFVEVAKGTPKESWPQQYMPGSMPSDAIQMMWELYGKVFENFGISQMSAASKKPDGIRNASAMMTLLDAETSRFALVSKGWERFHVELAKKTVGAARKVSHRSKGGYKVFYRAKDFIETIDFSKVDLAETEYVLKVYPTNLLPTLPAGRLEMVDYMSQRGWIDGQTALALLDFPDVKRQTGLATAAIDDIDAIIEHMLLRGEYVGPEEAQLPYMPLAVERITSAMVRAKINGAPEKVLSMFRDWVAAANQMIERKEQEEMQKQMAQQQAMAPPPAPGQGAGPGPQGEMAPPQEPMPAAGGM